MRLKDAHYRARVAAGIVKFWGGIPVQFRPTYTVFMFGCEDFRDRAATALLKNGYSSFYYGCRLSVNNETPHVPSLYDRPANGTMERPMG